ncbi:phosphoribosyl-ATP diphosphatase [Reyranella sp. CPCC 100927]|uniref:phosphoribosyl-ATP diphosphatase n=1 Tax=Reyranella sp. CPCC 100927 TaxID=2599616 RepID=UPI0011B7B62F|nr:phosphoribosyl-ATP diphosphatase [Reyranella sp. CPCC 100927]TWT12651.1 phosphoribosyl-ATP diphosphatase [Reyranella sp. CPCC 100927]
MSARIQRLYEAGLALKGKDATKSKTSRLFAAGRGKLAKKLGEEAMEVVIEAVKGDRQKVIHESADLLYHLVMVWADLGIPPKEIWKEMDQREAQRGIAEKTKP